MAAQIGRVLLPYALQTFVLFIYIFVFVPQSPLLQLLCDSFPFTLCTSTIWTITITTRACLWISIISLRH